MLIRIGNRVRVLSAPRSGMKSPQGVIGVVTAEARSLPKEDGSPGGMTCTILPANSGERTEVVSVFTDSDLLERYFW